MRPVENAKAVYMVYILYMVYIVYRPLSQSCAERAILHGSEAKGL